jgi:succinate dehydrogenase/fumarate reductase flavoprotein subunit
LKLRLPRDGIRERLWQIQEIARDFVNVDAFEKPIPIRPDVHWLKHSLVRHTAEGPAIDYAPVTITQWQPQARAY